MLFCSLWEKKFWAGCCCTFVFPNELLSLLLHGRALGVLAASLDRDFDFMLMFLFEGNAHSSRQQKFEKKQKGGDFSGNTYCNMSLVSSRQEANPLLLQFTLASLLSSLLQASLPLCTFFEKLLNVVAFASRKPLLVLILLFAVLSNWEGNIALKRFFSVPVLILTLTQ